MNIKQRPQTSKDEAPAVGSMALYVAVKCAKQLGHDREYFLRWAGNCWDILTPKKKARQKP